MTAAEAPETNQEQAAGPKARRPLYQAAHRLFLTGIGAVLVSKEELEHLAGRLVERGELAEKDRHKRLREKYKGRFEEHKRRHEEKRQRKQTAAPADSNAPDLSGSELAALNEKLALLSKQIDDLNQKWG